MKLLRQRLCFHNDSSLLLLHQTKQDVDQPDPVPPAGHSQVLGPALQAGGKAEIQVEMFSQCLKKSNLKFIFFKLPEIAYL